MSSIKSLGPEYNIGEYQSSIYRTNTKTNTISFSFNKSYKEAITDYELESNNIAGAIILTVLFPNGKNIKKEIPINIDDKTNDVIEFNNKDESGYIFGEDLTTATHFRYQLVLASKTSNSLIINNIKIFCKGIKTLNETIQEGSTVLTIHTDDNNKITDTSGKKYSLSDLTNIYYNGSEDLFNHIIITSQLYNSSSTSTYKFRESNPYKRKVLNNKLSSYYRLSLPNAINSTVESEKTTNRSYNIKLSPKTFVKNINDSDNISCLNKRLYLNIYIPNKNTNGQLNIISGEELVTPIKMIDNLSTWFTSTDISEIYKFYSFNQTNTNLYSGSIVKVIINNRQYICSQSGLYEINLNNLEENVDINITLSRENENDSSPCVDFISIENDNYYEELISVGKGKSIECEVNAFIDYIQTKNGKKPYFTKIENNQRTNYLFDIRNVGFKLPYWYNFETINESLRNPFSINIPQSFKLKYPNVKIWINHSINSGELLIKGNEITFPNISHSNNLILQGQEVNINSTNTELWIKGGLIGVIEPYLAIEYDLEVNSFIYPATTTTLDDDYDKYIKSKFMISSPFEEENGKEYKYCIKFADIVFENPVKYKLSQRNIYDLNSFNEIESFNMFKDYNLLNNSLSNYFYLTIINADEVDYALNNYIIISKGYTGIINSGNTQDDYYRIFNIEDIPGYENGFDYLQVKAENENINMSWSIPITNDEIIIQTEDIDICTYESVNGVINTLINNYSILVSPNQTSELYIPYESLNNILYEQGLTVNENSKFKINTLDANILYTIKNDKEGIYIYANKAHDIRNEWLPTIREGYYNIGSDFYYFNPNSSTYMYTNIDTPIIEGLTLIDGNDGKMGRISNKQEVINNNILNLDEKNLEYYCLEEF